ncbi:molybdopterin-dependent oxidoreductase, partial [Sphingobium sp.]|uniref:molybdopterin-containing oxidoreductase family protein n=1 Tax=Sphingobium sp. TaxID=1912891 RepID=UPI0028BDD6BC
RPGTDAALAMGMLNVIIGEGLMKTDYVTAHTNLPFLVDRTSRKVLREHDLTAGGSDEALVWDEASDRPLPVSLAQKPALRKSATLIAQDRSRIDFCTAFDASWDVLKTFTPEYASQICEVPAAQIVHVAKEYASHERPWIWFGLGPQRYHHGHSVARAWLTLTAVCGNIGKPYAGISMYDGPNIVFATIPHSEWLEPGGRKSSPLPGTQMVDILRRQAPYPVKTLWLAMYGFATQGPQFKRFLTEALPNLDLLVVNEQMMTPAAEYADVVLPTVSYYEDDWDLVGSGESWWVQLRRQAVEPIGSSRSDFDIYKGLCERMGRGDAWQMEKEESCRHIMRTHPDPRIRAVDWESLRENGVAEVPVERPYTPFRDMKFNTPSGRMELYQEQFIDVGEEVLVFKEQAESRRSERARAYPLNLITYKVVHSAHSTHLMLPYIREQLPEPRLDVSPVDAAARGIEDGDWVTAFNDRGKFTVRASISSTLRSGTVAMPAGWWQRFFRNGHPADLGHIPLNEIQERIAETNYPNWDVLCQLRKADES